MIYVSGPALNTVDDSSLPAAIYREIVNALDRYGEKAQLPIRTPSLNSMGPRDFYLTIAKLIESARGVITVLVPGDQSTVVEAATASLSFKQQSILVLGTYPPPRLLQGLTNVVDVVKVDPHKLKDQIEYVVTKLLGSIGPASPAG